MKGSSPRGGGENGSNEEVEWEVRPGGMLVQRRDDRDDGLGSGGPPIKIKVVHGSNQLDLVVPCQSTFGDLKRCISQQTGLDPEVQRLLFRGKEKEDQEHLHMVGVKDNAKVLLMEEQNKERKHEGVQGSDSPSSCPAVNEMGSEIDKLAEQVSSFGVTSQERKLDEVGGSNLSKDCAAVAEVRAEVDKLAEQVVALEAVIHGGTMVEEKEFIVLTELLMRQLLKLDSIEAEGEGKVQRKLEVHRVQCLVDKVDSLKARNGNPFNDRTKMVSVTTNWETFDSGMGSLAAPPPLQSSTKVTQDWEQFD
ncbi:hypothetical protein NMG60_11036003 [Bertholletia excelsa]